MRRASHTFFHHGFRLTVLACIATLGAWGAQAQTVSVDIIDVLEAAGDTITIYTPGGLVPATIPATVEASAISNSGPQPVAVALGLDGAVTGPSSWSGAATAGPIPGVETSSYVGQLNIAQGFNIFPNTISPFTLRAFAFTDNYYAVTGSSIGDFNGVSAPLDMFLDIRDLNASDADRNGIPNSDILSNLAPPDLSQTQPITSFVTPDPDDSDDPLDPDYADAYVVGRVVQSLNEGLDPKFMIVNKQMVADFQFYDLQVSVPNLAWFRANNFTQLPAIIDATNAVLVVWGEDNPHFIVDNYLGQADNDANLLPQVDILSEWFGDFSDEIVPTSFFHISVLLEVAPAEWVELDLDQQAPIFVTVRSVALNDAQDTDDDGIVDIDVYRYTTSTRQSTEVPVNIQVVGDGMGWSRVNTVSDPVLEGFKTKIIVQEFVRGAVYGIAFDRTLPPENGGGGGG
ncbi:MAG: hypothetical protein VCD00_09045, partial [Candidatus Hydrogenedentota bacterium]